MVRSHTQPNEHQVTRPAKLAGQMTLFASLPNEAGVSILVACAILDRSRASIWRDLAAGRLESFSIGRSRRINVGSIRRACASPGTEARHDRAI